MEIYDSVDVFPEYLFADARIRNLAEIRGAPQGVHQEPPSLRLVPMEFCRRATRLTHGLANCGLFSQEVSGRVVREVTDRRAETAQQQRLHLSRGHLDVEEMLGSPTT